jgi:hypothetical protein
MPFSNDRRLLYDRWRSMIARCTDPKHPSYERYGARGIVVDQPWVGTGGGFQQWLEDMGDPPTMEHTIERIDNNGPYSKANCRWAAPGEQGRNTRVNRNFTWNGETKTCTDWANDARVKAIGLTANILLQRHRAKWPAEEALTRESDKNTVTDRRGRPKNAAVTDAQVREVRRLAELGWTQTRIAEQVGLKQTKVSKIIRGEIYERVQ